MYARATTFGSLRNAPQPKAPRIITSALFCAATVQITPNELRRLHEQRARRIMTVAAQNKAEVLILGAFGCGAFRNDPNVVAQAYKNILPEFMHHFGTIEYAVYCPPHDDSNYRAFKSILG